jgi:hypothetical protein
MAWDFELDAPAAGDGGGVGEIAHRLISGRGLDIKIITDGRRIQSRGSEEKNENPKSNLHR